MAECTSNPVEDLEPSMRGTLGGGADSALAFARWEHPAPRGRVVISHGYGEHGERYRHVACWLNQRGWAVSSLDHRGFGRSAGRRGDSVGIAAGTEDLTLFLRQERMHDAAGRPRPEGLLESAPPWPQILLGHSFGGLLALLALLWHPETMDGLIVTSPALRLRPIPIPLKLLQRLLIWVAPHRCLNLRGDKTQVCRDPVLVQRYLDDPLCHHSLSAAFLAAMEKGWEELAPFGGELDRPILLLESGADTVTDPDGAEQLWSAVRPGLLERHRLESFYHEILHDPDRAEAERIADLWLDRHFPGVPAVPTQGCS